MGAQHLTGKRPLTQAIDVRTIYILFFLSCVEINVMYILYWEKFGKFSGERERLTLSVQMWWGSLSARLR